ncbi:MAG: transporter substrate-binding protein [Pirellulales bacterium]|nr:transporter substrate-binding protein [Pirellulales bacterium]
MLAFVEGRLSNAEADRVRQHLSGCEHCRHHLPDVPTIGPEDGIRIGHLVNESIPPTAVTSQQDTQRTPVPGAAGSSPASPAATDSVKPDSGVSLNKPAPPPADSSTLARGGFSPPARPAAPTPGSAPPVEVSRARITLGPSRHVTAVGSSGAPPKGRKADARYPFLDPPRVAGDLGWLSGYRVVRLIGSGGMGQVFEAIDETLARRVAIKVVHPQLAGTTNHERFLQEARAAAALPGEHIATIYQAGFQGDVPFLAMEYLTGETLEARLERDRWLPLSTALRIAREAAQGLAAAHAHGVIHRDVKPANLWLESARPGDDLKGVKLLDFGIARAIERDVQVTRDGEIVGTPHFMAPEQARGEAVDPRTDLFGLGCVMYYMLSGQVPFGTAQGAALMTLVSPDPVDLTALDGKVPRSVIRLVGHLLEKDPDRRPADAAAVIDAINRIEENEMQSSSRVALPMSQIIAGPIAPRRRLAWGAMMGAACILASLAVGGIALYYEFYGRGPAAGATADGQNNSVVGDGHSTSGPPGKSPQAPAPPPQGEPILVGILHSLTGTMANSELPVSDAAHLAVEELNAAGGLLGRPVEARIVDGASDEETFATRAEELIARDKVSVIFGCWTSSSRKRVKEVVERHDNLLVYPLAGEGLEQSPNILYLGGPNHKLMDAAKWCFAFLEKRKFLLVGSDYVFPRAANAIIKDQLSGLGAQVVGEVYVPLGETDMSDVVKAIDAGKPDVILNTINGDSNVAFFRRLRSTGLDYEKVPIVSFSIAETDLRAMRPQDVVGTYACWCWFERVPGASSADFVARFRHRFGASRLVGDPEMAAHTAVHLWAQAVTAAGTADPAAVRKALLGQSRPSPEGTIHVDPELLACWRTPRIGRILPDLSFEVVWQAPAPLRPVLYPPSRTPEEWNAFLEKLYRDWGNHWTAPHD